MASQIQDLHLLLIPLMSQSYLIPMLDFAKLLAHHGVTVSIITTPLNASRFQAMIDRRSANSNLKIQLITIWFPCQEAGLPEGCEILDTLTSPKLLKQFFMATFMLQKPLEKLIATLEPRASCIVTSNALPWTTKLALNLDIPRFLFQHVSSFAIVCSHSISSSKIDESVDSDTESFQVPDLPDEIVLTRAQIPDVAKRNSNDMKGTVDLMKEAELSTHGVLINSFDEMESKYADVYRKLVKKVWCVGPVSLCNKDVSDKIDRGHKASIDEHYCLKWLDSMKPGSVMYACFGSLYRISCPQLTELALGLEASNRPFVWIIRKEDQSEEMEKWLADENFEVRTIGRGLVIRGWAPQVLMLSHPAVGGFLTHCGWNSVAEGVSAGVPMITWPMFAEQFYNERYIVNVKKIGVRIGVEVGTKWAEEHNLGVLVKKEDVKNAIDRLMREEEEAGERRKRARELAELAKRATEEGGSSHLNMKLFIQDVLKKLIIHKSSTQEHGMYHGPCSPVSPNATFQAMSKSGKFTS